MPPDLRVLRIGDGTEQYLLFSYPLPRWNLPSELTRAESQVVRAVLEGASRAQIARSRDRATRTVSNLLAQVFGKLRVGSRIELASKLARRE